MSTKRKSLEQLLADAEERLTIAEANISRQQEIVANMERRRQDTRSARSLLRELQTSRDVSSGICNQLREKLAASRLSKGTEIEG
jgi:hypothetical protein